MNIHPSEWWARGTRVATLVPSETLPNQRVIPDRDNGRVVLPAVVRNREPEATNELACGAVGSLDVNAEEDVTYDATGEALRNVFGN
jgi:hypothetical protein